LKASLSEMRALYPDVEAVKEYRSPVHASASKSLSGTTTDRI